MKKLVAAFLLIASVMLMAGCKDLWHPPENEFTDIPSLTAYLSTLPGNSPSNPYTVVLNVASLPRMNNATFSNRFVNLDLSDSTIPGIGDLGFTSCVCLTGITLPNSVTSIGQSAFFDCGQLARVTFRGTIPASGFSTNYPFNGDLRGKFYAMNSYNGTPGTYRTSGPSYRYGAVWTRL